MAPKTWKDARLGDHIELTKGASYRSAELQGGDALVGIKCIPPGGGFRRDGLKPFSGKRKPAQELRDGDTIVALTDLTQAGDVLGRPATVRAEHSGRLVASLDVAKLTVTSDVLDHRYLFHLLRGPDYGAWARGHATGTTVRHLSPKAILDYAFPMPPAEEQRRIASVLDSFEVAANAAQSLERRLETALEMLFDDVVRRDASSWEEGDLTTLARFVNGKNFTKEATGSGRPVIRIRELNSGIGGSTVWNNVEAPDDFVANHFDLLFAWSGTLGVHRWHGTSGLVNQHIFKVIPHDGIPVWFVEGWVRRHLRTFIGIAKDKATTMGHIKRRDLSAATVRIPDEATLATLQRYFGPLDALRACKAREAARLIEARDRLLPRLVAGRLPVNSEYETTAIAKERESVEPLLAA